MTCFGRVYGACPVVRTAIRMCIRMYRSTDVPAKLRTVAFTDARTETDQILHMLQILQNLQFLQNLQNVQFLQKMQTTKTKFAKVLFDNDDLYKLAINEIPMNRHAEPNEMAGTVLYLTSSASSYTTGECIVVDGGYLI